MCTCVPTHLRFAFKHKIKYDYAAERQKEHWRYGTRHQTSSRKQKRLPQTTSVSKCNKILHLKFSVVAIDAVHSKRTTEHNIIVQSAELP
jgi:hypothetical protein